MTRLTLEIKDDKELAILSSFLKLLNVKILRQEKKIEHPLQEAINFYNGIAVDLTNFKFNREEANER